MFLYFAFISLKIDEDETKNTTAKYGAIITVSLAFFLGELGDKTQLAALGLSLNSNYVPFVLLGTVTGMVLTSAIGIFIGLKLGKKIPEDKLKLSSFLIFIIFGIQKIYTSYLYALKIQFLIMISIIFLLIIAYTIKKFLISYRYIENTKFTRQSELLKSTKTKIAKNIELLCKGVESCKVCDGKDCLVGYMKFLLKNATKPIDMEDSIKIGNLKNKNFDKKESIVILNYLIEYYNKYESEFSNNLQLSKLRNIAEVIAFNECIKSTNYKEYLKIIDSEIHN